MTKTTKFQQLNPEAETREEKPGLFRVLTCSIHKGREMDRRNRVQRVAEILQGLKLEKEEMRYGWKKDNR